MPSWRLWFTTFIFSERRIVSITERTLSPFVDDASVATLHTTPVELLSALALVLIGAVVQGSIGFGIAVVAAPVLLLVNRVFLPGPVLLATTFLTGMMTIRDREHVAWPDVAVCTGGRFVGMLPAAVAVKFLSTAAYDLMFSLAVLAGVAISVAGWKVRLTLRNLFATAIGSGFMSTISAIGGPPMALAYQHERGPKIRGTLSAIFTLGAPISIVGLWWAGKFGIAELILGVLLLPAIFVGFFLSRFTAGRLDQSRTRPAILTLSGVTALVVMIQSLVHILWAQH